VQIISLIVHAFTQALASLRALTSSLFGIGAGILGLESYSGFIFYLIFSLLTSALIFGFRVAPAEMAQADGGSKSTVNNGGMFFSTGYELWVGGLLDGLSGFVLTWTLAYGLVRA